MLDAKVLDSCQRAEMTVTRYRKAANARWQPELGDRRWQLLRVADGQGDQLWQLGKRRIVDVPKHQIAKLWQLPNGRLPPLSFAYVQRRQLGIPLDSIERVRCVERQMSN